MTFGDEILMFLNQIFAEDTAIFKFLEDNTINMVFSNNKLYCNKEELVKAYNHFTGKNLCWESLSRNFGHYRMSTSHDGSRDGLISIKFPDDFSLDKKFNRHWEKFSCEFPGCEYIGIRSNLRNHMRNHKRPSFSCNISGCGYSTITDIKLKKHQRTHHAIKPSFSCPMADCGYSTFSNSRLKLHILRHTDNGSYPCTVAGCPYIGNMHRNLKVHMRAHERAREKVSRQFHCEVPGCGRIFKIRMTLLNHMHFRHKPLEDLEKPLEKPLEDLEKPLEEPLEDLEKPLEKEADLPEGRPDDEKVIDVDDQTTVIDVDDDATVVDDDVNLLS